MKILASALFAAVVLASAASATTGPRLAVSGNSPLTVVGSGFAQNVRVLLNVKTGTLDKSKWVRSSATGRFATSFMTLSSGQGCHGAPLVATATVAGRVRVTLKIPGSSRDCAQIQPVNK
jgi:hypothetical protein